MERKTFGEFLKILRAKKGLTLRAFCQQYAIDPGNWSKLERGILPPPHGTKLAQYAQLVGLEKGTDDWLEFFDLAAAAKGALPCDIMRNENIVNQLPVLFRTLRGQKVDPDKLDELINTIRNG